MADKPDQSAEARTHRARGDALYAQRDDLAGALRACEDAIRCGIDPLEVGHECWTCAMLLGDFEAAWRIGDYVLAERPKRGLTCHHWPWHERWVWDGTPLEGRDVLIRCYLGLGDIIQFIRFAAPLRKIARSVTVQAPPAVLPLIAPVRGVERVVPLSERETDPPFDVDVEVMELPHALRITLEALPADVPYVVADPRLTAARRRELGGCGEVLIGLAWAAGAPGSERSLPVRLLRPLADIPGVTLVNLQRGDAALAEFDQGPVEAPSMLEWGGRTTDFLETAATVSALDLVITVDTMIAHLAGALGVPVWTLLPFHANWRWMATRNDSPWYPSMRLYRQPAPDAWPEVIHEVAATLREHVSRASRCRSDTVRLPGSDSDRIPI